MPHRRSRSPKQIIAALAAVYLVGFLATYGHERVAWEHCKCSGNPVMAAGFAAAYWPFYIPMRLSYLYFRGSE